MLLIVFKLIFAFCFNKTTVIQSKVAVASRFSVMIIILSQDSWDDKSRERMEKTQHQIQMSSVKATKSIV